MARISIVDSWYKADLVTHPAPHHADEVFATIMLARVWGNINEGYSLSVCRTRNPEAIAASVGKRKSEKEQVSNWPIVCDIGGVYSPISCFFDHHMADFDVRRNPQGTRSVGTKYASAGLVWKEYGEDIVKTFIGGMPVLMSKEMLFNIVQTVDRMLIEGIDAFDNGELEDQGLMSVSTMMELMNAMDGETTAAWAMMPGAKTQEDHDFLLACAMAERILERTIKYALSIELSRDYVLDAIRRAGKERRFIVLSDSCSTWRDIVLEYSDSFHNRPMTTEEIEDTLQAQRMLFCVYPRDGRCEWCVQAIPPSRDKLTGQRRSFPVSWRGVGDAELVARSGVEGAIYCHPGGFFATARTKSAACELAEKACKVDAV